ncbi:NADPH:quinone oxidoreductase family protein [Neorhizobium sp. LjRoot104]|uniref:NADPH:quinone oxidoreductase family protein n=1 Tax=Neorhizobium sp. LjRoot104 TaxID=3342254 RepID=UPI003ECCDF8C
MRRFSGNELGSLKNFAHEVVVDPSPGRGEVRIRVQAVALGFVDGLIVAGRYQMIPTLPFTPGGEIAGVVDMIGPDVQDIRIGARVVAWQLGGGLAECAIVPAAEIDVIPAELGMVTAAAMIVDYQTASYALVERGQLKPGETVLVAGAAGGVGSAALQIARNLGARVIALVSDPSKHSRAMELGATVALSPSDPNLRNELRRYAPAGVNVVVDPVGGSLSETLFRSLAKEGRHLVIGFAAGSIPTIRSNLALLKSASLVGVDLRHFVATHPDAARRRREELFRQVLEGRLAPPITALFEFHQAKEALETTTHRARAGKLVVLLR